MINQFFKKVKRKITSLRENRFPLQSQDDFDWSLYNYHYQLELDGIQKVHTLRLSHKDYNFNNNILVLEKEVLPLHPNHRLLYETILQLSPMKLFEVGCGGGDHLYNLSVLSSDIHLYGCDLSEEQIAFLKVRNPELRANIEQFDITLPFSSLLPSVNIAYTQAVIMHLKTANNHLVALSNLFKLAQNQVVLMENWSSHNFMSDINFLFDRGMIPWKSVYFYIRRSPELNNQPHLMVVSSSKLDYEELLDYKYLLQNL